MSKAGASLATCYGPVSADVITRAENIRLLILDVDGVLSDGLIYMGVCAGGLGMVSRVHEAYRGGLASWPYPVAAQARGGS